MTKKKKKVNGVVPSLDGMPSAVNAIKSSTVDNNGWLVSNNSFLNTQVCAEWKVLLGLDE